MSAHNGTRRFQWWGRTKRNLPLATLLVALVASLTSLVGVAPTHAQGDGRAVYLPLVSGGSGTNPNPNPGTNGDLGFRTKPNGFSFENWGEEAENANDLGAEDLIRLFGRDKVCRNAEGECVLNAAARQWTQKQLKSMNGGHCEGMAVLSVQLLKGLDFKGKKLPSDYLPGANSTFDLTKASTRNAIAYYFVTQGLDPVAATSSATRDKKPSDILKLVQDSFNGGSELYTLGIYKRFAQGAAQGGHAITPYKVEDKGGGKFWMYVYDNNFPQEERYVEFDTTNDTWLYKGGATQAGASVQDYDGDATTRGLDLTPLSLRNQQMECPFCNSSSGLQTAGVAADGTPIQVFVAGEGNLMITNAAGQRVGFDGTKNVNQIPGAEVQPFRGGLGKHVPPYFELPASDKPYSFLLDGEWNARRLDADLVMSGAGYTVGFEQIKLDPLELLGMRISPNGRQMVFRSTVDTERIGMFLATDPTDPAQAGYIFNIDGFALDAGGTVTMTLDLARGHLFFDDDDGNADQYDIKIERIEDDGVTVFENDDALSLPEDADARLDFGAWDAEDDGDDALGVTIDDEGNGFDDDTAIEVPDEP